MIKRGLFLILSLAFSLFTNAQLVFNNSLLRIEDNVPLLNQVTSRTAFVPFTDAANNDWQGRYYPVKLQGDTIVAIWMEGTFHSDYNSASHLTNIHFSADGGATWTDNNEYFGGGAMADFPLVPPDANTGFMDYNFFEAANGDLIIHAQNRGTNASAWNGVNFSIYQYRSTDRGENWSLDGDLAVMLGYTGAAGRASIQGELESVRIGNSTYITYCEIGPDNNLNDTKIRLARTDDNAANWVNVNDIVAYDESDPDCTESSLSYLGAGRMFFVFRTQDLASGSYKICEDFGATCGALTTFEDELDYVGIHQPHIDDYSNFTIAMGRDNKKIIDDPGAAIFERNSFWITSDFFNTVSRRQYLDPFYTGDGNANNGDAGYTRAVPIDNDNYLFFGYYGTNSGPSLIYKYEVSHTPTPSNEQYSNLTFFPETLTSTGIRLQWNRDNCAVSPVAVPAVGIGVISRSHNYLTTGSNAFFNGGNAPELVIENNEGWAYFDGSGHVLSGSSLQNTFFQNSFSYGFWADPSDGQPAAVQVFFRASNLTSTTNDDLVVCQLQTTGALLVRYAADGTLCTFITGSPVFTDGDGVAHHIAVTMEEGVGLTVYVDGVSVASDGVNTGAIGSVNMNNYSSTLDMYWARRQTGASTFDLGYIGKMREFVLQPILWTSGNVASIMSN